MSRYKRNSIWSSGYSSTTKSTTKVDLYWSSKSGAYALKFNDTKHWNEMQVFISYIKTQPTNERDYDPVNKVWYFIEKHLPQIQEMFKLLPNIFEVDFVEKPVGQANIHTFVPVDTYLDKFKTLTGEDLKGKEYNDAKKVYRKLCLKYHPDIVHNNEPMSSINQLWTELEKVYFLKTKEMEYV